jgi:Tol biopolymer transport system component
VRARLLAVAMIALAAHSIVTWVPRIAAAQERVASRPSALIVFTNDQLYSIRADGTQRRQLTSGFSEAYWPQWSPDGRWIAFAGRRASDPGRELYVMGSDGSGLRRLTSVEGRVSTPAWSPGGGRLAFVDRDSRRLFVVRADGTGLKPVTQENRNLYFPAWSPDGREIAFESCSAAFGDCSIRVVNVTTGDLTDIGTGWAPAWSPGLSIAFLDSSWLSVVSRDGNSRPLVPIAPAHVVRGPPAWSPDGGRIAFVDHSPTTAVLRTVERNGKRLRSRTRWPSRNGGPCLDDSASWSSEGKRLAFVRQTSSVDCRLEVMRADGSHPRLLQTPLPVAWPQWQPVPAAPGLPFTVVDSGPGYPSSGAPGVEITPRDESVDLTVRLAAPTPGYSVEVRRLSAEKVPPGSKRLWCVEADRVGPGSAYQVITVPFQTVRVERRLVGDSIPREWVLRGSDRHLIGASSNRLRSAC